jgi:bifunctional oligoribonuclease and PAP phosphatase NrnA
MKQLCKPQEVEKLIEVIKKAKSVAIFSHVGPDGDTLGSMLAMGEILSQIGTVDKIDLIIMGKTPDIYGFLPDINKVKNHFAKGLYQNYDLAITVDCGALDRLGESVDLFRNAKTTANIDHHFSNTKFASINWIEPCASSCGQMLYYMVDFLGATFTKDIATNLYTAIITDTGAFKFENTKPETFEICAKLLEAGADPVYIYKKCYESKPLSMIKLHAKAVEQAVFLDNNKIAYTAISREMLDSFGATDDHIDGICETLRQVDTIEVSLVFKETIKGGTKVSFRSNGLNVCDIARYFGGGGHKLASGCTLDKKIPEAISEILPIIRKQISKLHS